jgi:hypothetical protein
MNTVSITIDEHLKYSIDLKSEYEPNEFINTFESHIQKIRNLLSLSKPNEAVHTTVTTVHNDAFG